MEGAPDRSPCPPETWLGNEKSSSGETCDLAELGLVCSDLFLKTGIAMIADILGACLHGGVSLKSTG